MSAKQCTEYYSYENSVQNLQVTEAQLKIILANDGNKRNKDGQNVNLIPRNAVFQTRIKSLTSITKHLLEVLVHKSRHRDNMETRNTTLREGN